MKGSVPCTGSILSEINQYWEIWYTAKEKIQQHFQGCIRPSFVRQVCFVRKSTEFHDMRTECQRKIILIYFLLYSFFNHSPITCAKNFSLSNHMLPNHLLPNHFLYNAQSLITFSPDHSPPDRSIALTHPIPSFLLSNLVPDRLIALPLIFGK